MMGLSPHGIILGIAVALTSVPAMAQHQGHDMAGHGGAPAETQPGDTAPLYTTEDVQFLHHMSVHHQQALDMSELIPGRSAREEFRQFGRYVYRGQQKEILTMQAMASMAAEKGIQAPHHHMDADPPMAGMLSSAEMAALEAAEGEEFERLWLTGMIYHHEGGLAMARAQQLHQLESGHRPYGLDVLVEEIHVVQLGEVMRMYEWLEEWNLVEGELPDTRAPASEVSSPPPDDVLSLGQDTLLIGTAVDDSRIESVSVGIQNVDTGQWWQADGGWGDKALHAADLSRSGPGSAAWSLRWTPPETGTYAIAVRATDSAGKAADARETRQVRVE